MKKKNKITDSMYISLTLLIFLCACGKTSISQGKVYRDENLNIEITPPTGWEVFNTNNPLVDGMAFYPTKPENARLYITSRTKLTESAMIVSEGELSLEKEKRINEYRLKLKRKRESKILKDEQGMFNSIPTHVIKASYMSNRIHPTEETSQFIEHNKRFYVIGYWIVRDQDYEKNSDLIQKSLKTLKFKEQKDI